MKILSNSALRLRIETVFKVLLLLYTMLGACNLTYGTPIISVVMYPTFLLGGLLILWRLLLAKQFLRSTGLPLLILLLLSYLLSTAMNIAYLSTTTVSTFILWCFYFLLLFLEDPARTETDMVREMRLMAALYLVYVTVLLIISLVMFFTDYSYVYRDPDNASYEVASGFFAGRLWGAFQDPNLGAILCCIAAVFSVYFMWYKKNVVLTVLLCANIAVMEFYIALSDSRNGMVAAGCVAGIALFFLLFRKLRGEKGGKGILKRIGSLVIVGVVALASAYLPRAIQNGYNAIVRSAASDSNPNITPGNKSDTKLPPVIDRSPNASAANKDRGNQRIEVWESGLQITKLRPLYGVSFEGIVPFAKEYLPDTYIISNGNWEFNTLDNDYLNVLAAQGIPGFIIMIALVGLCAVRLLKNIWHCDGETFPLALVCSVIVVSLAVSALFQGTMFYQQTPNTVIFWLLLGMAIQLLSKKQAAVAGEAIV